MPSPKEELFRALRLCQQGRKDEAARLLHALIVHSPDYFDGLQLLGTLEIEAGNLVSGVGLLKQAVRIDPDFAPLRRNLGNGLKQLGNFDEALDHYGHALRLAPGDIAALAMRAYLLVQCNRLTEASAVYDEWITLEPDNAVGRLSRALCWLVGGDFERGWAEYEWRYRCEPLASANRFEQPQWMGTQSLRGKTILLHAEQGMGDAIQFCRYAPMVAALGATVLLAARKSLHPLLATLQGAYQLLDIDAPFSAFDFHCPLMSLPFAFSTRLETIPSANPYLQADPNRVGSWAARIGPRNKLRVGLSWSGNTQNSVDARRSIPLAVLDGLRRENAEFFSLQPDLRESDRAALGGLRHFDGLLVDFGDTAALIELMDIVISVDTSVAHLAGALGKPVWVLLPFAPDWRWMLGRDDSPWYPSARLFRQSYAGNWPVVVQRAAGELRKWQL